MANRCATGGHPLNIRFVVAGYGNIAPATASGRVFCIFFALIGIPFTITVIKDLGVLMATSVSIVYGRFRKRANWTNSQAAQRFGKKYGAALTVVLVLFLLIVYIAIGGAIFMIWEDWNFLESFYFCFITMTTIGFGDLVPGMCPHSLDRRSCRPIVSLPTRLLVRVSETERPTRSMDGRSGSAPATLGDDDRPAGRCLPLT